MTPEEFAQWNKDKFEEFNKELGKVAKKEGWDKEKKPQSFAEIKAEAQKDSSYVPPYITAPAPKKKHPNFDEWQGQG